jgi:hypothetical protein
VQVGHRPPGLAQAGPVGQGREGARQAVVPGRQEQESNPRLGLGADVIDGFSRSGANGRDLIDLGAMPGTFVFIGTAAFGSTAANQVRYEAVDTDGNGTVDSTLVMLDNDTSNDVEAAILLRGYVGAQTATDFLL